MNTGTLSAIVVESARVLLSLRGIEKNFGGVRALRNGNLDINAGEVHLLMGENGAGKSTLMKIVAGMHAARRRRDALARHAGFVSHARPKPPRTASRWCTRSRCSRRILRSPKTSFLGARPDSKLGWVQPSRIVERARTLDRGAQFSAGRRLASGQVESRGQATGRDLPRALQQGSSLLIFDEPTSSLSESETQGSVPHRARVARAQMGVIYITHRLDELRSIGDRVTVLRDGETVHSGALAELTTRAVDPVHGGRDVNAIYRRDPMPPGESCCGSTA